MAATAAPTATTAATAAATTGAVTEPTISVATDAKLGKILVDQKGMTLYAFTKDTADTSNCTGNCLKAWPPLMSQGSPKAGSGVDASLLGTATLADGSKIVTYNHMPLYYWAKDSKPGDTTGQDVGKVWFVVSPDGKMVQSGQQVPATGGNSGSGGGGYSNSGSSASSSASGSSAPASGDVVVKVATDPKLGKILVDGKGMTLYVYTKDGPNQSNCTGSCMKAWPPLLTKSGASAGDGVDASLLGTATLADGSKIVTYNKRPLYYWASDTQPGDTTGQGVGNVWYVVGPDGKPVGATTQTGNSQGGGW